MDVVTDDLSAKQKRRISLLYFDLAQAQVAEHFVHKRDRDIENSMSKAFSGLGDDPKALLFAKTFAPSAYAAQIDSHSKRLANIARMRAQQTAEINKDAAAR